MEKYKRLADEVMFTSDHHFGHENIIKFCSRPFKDADHMTEVMVERWNEAVKPWQTVFHLGDFAFRQRDRIVPSLLNRLNGEVILIRGNHDHKRTLKDFTAVHDMVDLVVGNQRIILCHYGMRVWAGSHRGAWHLYGHSHGTLPPRSDRKEQDVGVDCWDFRPVSFFEIEGVMKHHGEESIE